MAKKKKYNSPYTEKVELYLKLLENFPEVDLKGNANPYTSLNGHMYSFLSKEGQFGIRLPKDSREEFLEKYNTELCFSYNTVMKEYPHVPDELLEKTEELAPYFKQSIEYIQSLKPKPTTKKKK